jgi:glycerol uptake facilitator-like aquaporin
MNVLARKIVAEFLGTFAIVFLSAGAVCTETLIGSSGGRIGIALVTACAWSGVLAITHRITGAFANPAITIMQWAFGMLDHRRAIGYLIAQAAASLAAGLAVRVLLFANEPALNASRLGTPHLNLNAFGADAVFRDTVLLGIGIEAILTFFLVLAIYACHYDPRFHEKFTQNVTRLSYLWLGLLVFASNMVGHSYTGAALNPARWFGTVVWEFTVAGLAEMRPFSDHAVYWIGPTVGAVLAGIVYQYAILPEQNEKQKV